MAFDLVATRQPALWRATLLSLDATATAVSLTDAEAALLGLAAGEALQVSALDPEGLA